MLESLINATETAAARAASAGCYEEAAYLLTASARLAGFPER